jgi:tetratricopeptide (TPR) repeat protein
MKTGCLAAVYVGGILGATLCFGADEDALAKRRELQALADREVVAAVGMYKEQGVAPALERIEQGYLLFEKNAGPRRGLDDYHTRVWREAQTLSGRQDEAWGLALWIYLFERRQGKMSLPPDRLVTYDYGLIFNLTESGFNLGKLADMRKWTRKLERSLEAQQGLDVSCKRYPDSGPLFSFLPDARKRVFPTRNRHLDSKIPRGPADRCINSYIMYALCAVSDSALYEGDWVRATELNQWYIEYARDGITTPEQLSFPSEVVSFALLRALKLTAICRMHGHPGEGVKVLDDFLEFASRYKGTGKKDILIARLERELLTLELGRMSADACETADKAVAFTGKNIWNFSRWEDLKVGLARARVYYAAGRKTEAWELVNQLLELGRKDVNPRHRIRILRMAIELALLDGGVHPELESWLKEALTNERKLGDKPAEIWLYERYAQFLMLRGRYREADVIQREVVRLAKAMKLPDRLASASAVLAQIRGKLDTQPGGGNATTEIQPRNSETIAATGTAVFSRFFLFNGSAQDCSGVLEISGPVTNLMQMGNAVIVATVSSGLFRDVLKAGIALPAGASCTIDLKGEPLVDGDKAKVEFAWIPEGSSGSTASASWTVQAGESLQRAAVIDAHELHQNPFYLLPLYHTLQRSVTNGTDTVDVMVAASEPVRVELYDAQTFALVSVDANGDGDFDDEGDLVALDKNGNLYPDLTLPEGGQLYSFLMYVAPLQGARSPRAITLAVSVREGSKWTVDSVDKVIFK